MLQNKGNRVVLCSDLIFRQKGHSPYAVTVTSLSVSLQQICNLAAYIEVSSTGIDRRKDRSDGKTREKT